MYSNYIERCIKLVHLVYAIQLVSDLPRVLPPIPIRYRVESTCRLLGKQEAEGVVAAVRLG